MVSKGISKTVKYSGLGKLDTLFGFLFGFVRSYIICVCLFSAVDLVYNYDKWPIDSKKSFTFSYVKKGSNYLIKEFPNEKNYEDAKDKVYLAKSCVLGTIKKPNKTLIKKYKKENLTILFINSNFFIP